jgi:hypothetical protein
MMKSFAACLSALVVVGWSSLAGAGPIADAAARAESLQAEGKALEALQAIDEAVDALWTEMPLSFRTVVLAESVGSLGTYTERGNSSFKPDEQLRVYVEPVGYGYGAPGAAGTIGFTADLAIENPTGQVLTEAKQLFSISAASADKWREFGMTFAFGVPYLRPGEYVAKFTVDDQNSDKTGTFSVPFTVTTP